MRRPDYVVAASYRSVTYAVTLALTIAAGVATYFNPHMLPLALFAIAALAHLHHLNGLSRTIEAAATEAAQKAIDAKIGEDFEYMVRRVKSINDTLAGHGLSDVSKPTPRFRN